MSKLPIDVEPRLWRCGICDAVAVWQDGWQWFGSWKHLDEHGEPELVVCSPICRATAEARGFLGEEVSE